MNIKDALISPIVTEKSSGLIEKGRYAFKVGSGVNKNQARQAIENSYGVKVKQIWSLNMSGKSHRIGNTRKTAVKSNWKKVIVQLDKDQKIELFEGGK